MKSKLGSSELVRLVIVPTFLVLGLIGGYAVETDRIYRSLKMTLVDTASVEYGSANYKIEELVDKLNGNIARVDEDIDTSQIGKQQLVVTIEKDGVEKDVAFEIEIKDTQAPEAAIKEEKISVQEGDSVNILDNIEKVYDTVDGDIDYIKSEEVEDGITNYYTTIEDINYSVPGEYPVKVKAVDKFGNESEATFKVEVTAKPKPVEPRVTRTVDNTQKQLQQTIANSAPRGDGTVVGTATAYTGYRYAYGGNNPATGFDCSGFVQYVLGQTGVSVSRSSSGQASNGVSVPYADARPGDILIWGHGSHVTHTALYIGGGQMVHATNPRQGVVESNVNYWNSHSDARLIDVRRVS